MPSLIVPGWQPRPLTGLIGYWPLSGDTANQSVAKDVSGNRNNATGAGGVMSSSMGHLGGSALTFGGGSTQYFSLPNTLFPLAAAARTLAIWANTSSIAAGVKSPMGYGTNTVNQLWGIYRSAAACDVRTGGTGDISVASVFVVGRWVHLAASYDGTSNRLYINGVLRSTLAAPNVNTIASKTSIGSEQAAGSGGEEWQGSLQDAYAYNRALSDAEIAALAQWRPQRRRLYFEPFLPLLATESTAEARDTASITGAIWRSAQVAALESRDTAAIAGSATTGAAEAATERRDTAAIATLGTLIVTAGPAEARDTAALAGGTLVGASVSVPERRDLASVGTSVTTGATVAAVESRDRVSINKVARTRFVARSLGILLYETLPLRTSGALGNFADDFVLAHRYGNLGRFKLERLDDKTFFAADHPMVIDAVFVDNQEYHGWEQALRTDGNGNTYTVVVLSAPAPDGAALSATGAGKRNPKTGALIENPADIAEDIMRLAGRDDRWWDQLRAEAGAVGLRAAGSLDESLSVREWLDRVLKSVGAIWCPGMARLYPCAVSGYVPVLENKKVKNLVARATLDNTADVLRFYYDPDKAGGRSQHFIELTANPKRYGGLPTELTSEWLRLPANAESVGKRMLPWLAGERYGVEFDSSDATLRPGQWVSLVAHPEWQLPTDPTIMLMTATVNRQSNDIHCTGFAVLSSPAAVVTAHSIGIPATRDASIEVAVGDGKLRIVARDPSGVVIRGALVNVDGGPAKTTDANGLAVFEATPGRHKVAIQAPGKRAQIIYVEA